MAEWRTGRKVGRTIYRDEVLVGVMDTPELAAEVVAALGAVGRPLGPPPPRALCPAGCGFVTINGERIGLHFNPFGQACTEAGEPT